MILPGSFGQIDERTTTLESGARPITLELFSPQGKGDHPAVILVHGSGGLKWSGEGYRFAARYLAAKGYLVTIAHYFESTGTTWADLSSIDRHSREWLEVLEQTVSHLRALPGRDEAKIGLVGFSLGAYLALALAVRVEGIACVVDFFGGLHEDVARHAGSLPPVLILHGDADRTVPVEEAYKLEKVLRANDIPYEISIYPGVGHGFHASISESALDAVARTERFLGEKLGAGVGR